MDETMVAQLARRVGLKVSEISDAQETPAGVVFRHRNDWMAWTMPTEADELGQHGLLSLCRHPRPGQSLRRFEGESTRAEWRTMGIPC